MRHPTALPDTDMARESGSRRWRGSLPNHWPRDVRGAEIAEQLSRVHCLMVRHAQNEVAGAPHVPDVRPIDHDAPQVLRGEGSDMIEERPAMRLRAREFRGDGRVGC